MSAEKGSVKAQVIVYEPYYRHRLGFIACLRVMSGNVYESRNLIWQLFKRDLLAGYRKSFLGFTWLFIMPIMGMISWVFLQKAGLLITGDVGIPYPAYVLVGTSMWGLFMGFFNAARQTLSSGQELMMQINFPHETLLVKQVANQLADFSITFIVNIVFLLLFGVVPSVWILVFPFVALPLLLLAAALGLMASMISIVAVDVGRGIGIIMGLLMYAVPVIYDKNQIAAMPVLLQKIIYWNPLTYLVCSCRDIIVYGRLYEPAGYFICAFLSIVVFFISWRLFFISEPKLIERMV